MLIIKVSLSDDTRRIAVEKLMSYTVLQQLVKNMFPSLQAVADFKLKYTDEEGDLISIATDFELEEACRQSATEPKVLRLRVEQIASASSPVLYPSESELLAFTVSDFKKDEPAPLPVPEPEVVPVSVPPANVQPSQVATAPAVASIATKPTDLPVLQLIEFQLASAMNAIASFMESLHIDQKMTDILADIHSNMKRATTAAQENIVNPLSVMTKSKASIAADHLEKLKTEITKLKALLEAEFGKAIDKITSLTSSAQKPTDVELKPVSPLSPPAQPSPVPEVKPATDVAQLVLSDLQKLADMGFDDRSRNLELLARYNGDLTQVVEALLR